MAKHTLYWVSIAFSFLSLICISDTAETGVSYDVLKYGARQNGKTDATKPFLNAWSSACRSLQPATIYVPKGRYLLKEITFRGPCKNSVTVRINGTLVGPDDYLQLGNSQYWILFLSVNNLSVIGGNIDAKGGGFWACRESGKSCPVGARSITFDKVNDGVINGLLSLNSQLMHLVIHNCTNMNVQNVRIIAPQLSPNTDGIHVQDSSDVTISNTSIKTGDDCISIGPGTRNLWMEKITCGPGHGVSIGSLGRDPIEDGVENVTLKSSIFTGSDNGLRIKTWARASTGFVTNINYINIVMNNVDNPIIIDQNYCPDNIGCPGMCSGINISEVRYQNIQGTSATKIGMTFDCSSSNPCKGIKLQDIKLTYLKRKPQSICNNIEGTTSGVIMPYNCL